MPLQVIDGGERQLTRGGEGLGGGEADEQRADQARTLGGGDEADVIERHGGLRERLGDDEVHELEVVAGGDLGHDPAVAVVHALGGDDVREHAPARVEHGGAGVVAAALERQDRPVCGEVAHGMLTRGRGWARRRDALGGWRGCAT